MKAHTTRRERRCVLVPNPAFRKGINRMEKVKQVFSCVCYGCQAKLTSEVSENTAQVEALRSGWRARFVAGNKLGWFCPACAGKEGG